MGPEQEKNKLINRMLSGTDQKHSIADGESEEDSLAGTFFSLIDVMDIAMWRLDLDYRVVGYNKKAKELYGENSLGDFCYHAAAKLDSVCNNCPAKIVYDGQESCRSEHKRIDSKGNEIYIDHIATPIKNKKGDVIGTLVLIIDVTHHKKQDKELQEHRINLERIVEARTKELKDSQAKYLALYEQSSRAEKLYKSLLNSSADAIVIYNIDGEVQYISPSFTELFGWQLEELRGKRIPFVPESEKEPTLVEIRKVLTTGEPSRNFQTKRSTKDGRLLDIYISASKYDDNEGNPLGLLVILKDITEARKLEKQLYRVQRLEALATLAGGIAHDFNNLLMGIQGNASLLLMECESQEEQVKKLKNIERSVQLGAYLTKQLLGLSKGGKYDVKPTDISQLVLDCSSMFGETKKEITIKRYFSEDIWPVEVDKGQMEQALLNLFVNAGQAMPMGGDLTLETRNVVLDQQAVSPFQLAPGKYVQIVITDTGAGIDDSIKDKIFDPFFTTKEMERGTGLGLASTYGIVRSHHGIIYVDSILGQGTTFTIYLPASTKMVIPEIAASQFLLHGHETILLVDDEKMVLDVVKQFLETLGYNVITACSGSEAIELLEKNKNMVEMVILDMIMPGMSGIETFDRLRELNSKIKILLSSGYSLDGQAADILNRGCNGFLQKPFNLNKLSIKMREILDVK